MKTLEVELTEQIAARLREAAAKLGISSEELVRISVEDRLARLDEEFRSAADDVLDKNAELYKRLA